MAYFRVPIRGDQDQATGWLALNGIQNVIAEDGSLIARLPAPDRHKARIRVVASLEEGEFEVGEPLPEDEGQSAVIAS